VKLPPRRLRRALAPLLLCIEVVLVVIFAVGTVLGALVAPVARHRRLLRVCAFGVGYLCIEMAALPLCAALWLRHRGRRDAPGWHDDHRRLLAWALRLILGWAGRCVGFRVVVDGPLGLLGPDGGPVLALARHGGPGDSFALVQLLLAQGRTVRIVLKEILELDPALDILLNRLDCCFLPSHAGAGEDLPARLADLAAGMGNDDALLVFPEGGNWTPRRRRRAIRRLREDHHHAAARAAALMPHVLPPRPAGVLAVLGARPDLPVVLLAHAGLDRLVSLGEAWRAVPLETPMTVRAWPTAPVPAGGEDERLAWLTTEWATVDEWIDAWHTHHPDAPGHITG
jgi:1-acyl-sn-glycerol-3-phosphate acyltransferase